MMVRIRVNNSKPCSVFEVQLTSAMGYFLHSRLVNYPKLQYNGISENPTGDRKCQ